MAAVTIKEIEILTGSVNDSLKLMETGAIARMNSQDGGIAVDLYSSDTSKTYIIGRIAGRGTKREVLAELRAWLNGARYGRSGYFSGVRDATPDPTNEAFIKSLCDDWLRVAGYYDSATNRTPRLIHNGGQFGIGWSSDPVLNKKLVLQAHEANYPLMVALRSPSDMILWLKEQIAALRLGGEEGMMALVQSAYEVWRRVEQASVTAKVPSGHWSRLRRERMRTDELKSLSPMLLNVYHGPLPHPDSQVPLWSEPKSPFQAIQWFAAEFYTSET